MYTLWGIVASSLLSNSIGLQAETRQPGEERPAVTTYAIDAMTCDRSPGCPARRVCPKGAIVPVAGGRYAGANGYTVIEELCSGCGVCMRMCPGKAISPK